MVAQHPQQWSVGLGIDLVLDTVHVELGHVCILRPPRRGPTVSRGSRRRQPSFRQCRWVERCTLCAALPLWLLVSLRGWKVYAENAAEAIRGADTNARPSGQGGMDHWGR